MRPIHGMFLLLAGTILVPALFGKPNAPSRKPNDTGNDIGPTLYLQKIGSGRNLENRTAISLNQNHSDLSPKSRTKTLFTIPPKDAAAIFDERPQIYRIGHLPVELPGWFAAVDRQGDGDGQIGLDEWVKFSGKTIVEFEKVDLNQDGVLTAEEYLKFQKAQEAFNEKQMLTALATRRQSPSTRVAPNQTKLEVKNGLMVPTTGVDDDDDEPAPQKQARSFRLRGRNGIFKPQSR